MVGNNVITIQNNYKKAFCEVDEIIKNMPENLSKKIPHEFRKFIKENKEEEYRFSLLKTDKVSNVLLLKETKILLSLIYRNYLISEQYKQELFENDREKLINIEKELQEKYSYENLFKKKSDNKSPIKIQNYDNKLPIEIKKEKLYKKIINFIKRLIKNRRRYK